MLGEVDLKLILTKRKSFKEEAERELETFKGDREAEGKCIELRKENVQEQVMTAMENCSVSFHPRTGKFEEFEGKKKGFQLPFTS